MPWINARDRSPEIGAEVLCRLQHCFSGNTQEYRLKCVDEDDCNWRTADDDAEIDYSWNVIEWFEPSSSGATEG